MKYISPTTIVESWEIFTPILDVSSNEIQGVNPDEMLDPQEIR